MIKAIQFYGFLTEDPNTHIVNFMVLCNVKCNSVTNHVIHLCLFVEG